MLELQTREHNLVVKLQKVDHVHMQKKLIRTFEHVLYYLYIVLLVYKFSINDTSIIKCIVLEHKLCIPIEGKQGLQLTKNELKGFFIKIHSQ